MEMLFLNKGIYHYIDAKVGMVTELENAGRMYQIHMLTENTLPYVLHSKLLCSNGEVWLSHSTESCYCLQNKLMQDGINGQVLRNILDQIVDCIKELEPFLLDARDLVLKLEYMFWDSVKRCIRVLCIPGYQKSVCEQIRELLEGIMPRFDHADYDGERFLYMCHSLVSEEWQGISGLINYLNTNQNSVFINNIIKEKDREISKKISGNNTIHIQNCIQEPERKQEEIDCGDTIFTKRFFLFVLAGGAALALIIKYLFFDGTTGTAIFGVGWLLALIVLAIMTVREKEDDYDDAMQEYVTKQEELDVSQHKNNELESVKLENPSRMVFSKLVPLTNGALEPLCMSNSQNTITVGRDRKTDYRVQTTQISRLHAKIYVKADGLFLEDQNSTNGTFINAKRIPALTEYKINKGDVIGFANEEFFVS